MADADNFKSTYQILLEISKVWHDLTDAQQAVLLEKIAGKHRASAVAAMLSDEATLVSAYEDALNSSGSAMEEFEKRTASVEYHLQQLYAAWQELSSNTVTVDFVNGVIDAARALVELTNNVGVLNIAVGGLGAAVGIFSKLKILPSIEAKGIEILTAAGYDEQADHSLVRNGQTASQSMIRLHGAASMLKTGLLALGQTAIWAGAAFAAFAAIKAVIKFFKDQKHEVENLTTSINDLESEIKSLQEQYDELNSKTLKTAADEQQIAILEKQIKLEQQALELEKERKAQRILQDSNDYFSLNKKTDSDYSYGVSGFNSLASDIDSTSLWIAKRLQGLTSDFTDSMNKAESAINKYKKNMELMESSSSSIEKCEEELKGLSDSSLEYSNVLSILATSQKNLEKARSKDSEYFNEAKDALKDLYTEQENLNWVIENGTELEQEEAERRKARLDLIVLEYEQTLGLADTYSHAASEAERLSKEVDFLNSILSTANQTKKITVQQMDSLKQKYPELADEVAKYCKQTQDGYILEEQAVQALANQFTETKKAQIQAQISMTETAITNASSRIAIYEEEIAALIQLYNTINSASVDKTKVNDFVKSPITSHLVKQQQAQLEKLASTEPETNLLELSRLSEDELKLNDYKKQKQILEDSKKNLEKLKNELNELNTQTGTSSSGNGTSLPSSGKDKNKNKDKDKVELWDKYAYSIKRAKEQLEAYDTAIEKTEAKLALNQANEERTLELREEEQALYDKLTEQYEAKRKATNDALWEQNYQLDNMYSRLSDLIGMDVNSNTLIADLQAWIDQKNQVDKDFTDSLTGQEIQQLISAIDDGRTHSNELYKSLYETKEALEELDDTRVKVKIDYENDALDKLDQQRTITDTIYDMLEGINGAESQRLSLAGDLIKSYEQENDEIYKMVNANYKLMNDLEVGTDEYNQLLEQQTDLIKRQLENIQQIYNLKKQTLEVEKEQAEVAAEYTYYGSDGKNAWEDAQQEEIDRLQAELDALDKEDDEQKYLDELAEKEKNIAELEEKLNNLRNQKTIQQLKEMEDGSFQWEYIEDEKAINETLADLEDARNNLQQTKDDKALEDQKQAIQDRIDAIQSEVDERQKQYERELQLIQDTYDAEISALDSWFTEEVNKQQQRIKDTEKHWKDMKAKTDSGMKGVDQTAKDNLAILNETFNIGLDNLQEIVDLKTSAVISSFRKMVEFAQQALEEVANMGGDSYDTGSYAKGLKFVDANNMLARLHYGERVLTRQEATQYSAMEDDIKSGKLQAYFDSLKEDAALSVSNVAANSIKTHMPEVKTTTSTTQFNISNITLPNVQEPADFTTELNKWARQEFGGLAQKGKIRSAR